LAKVLAKVQIEHPENPMLLLQECLAPNIDLQLQLQAANEEIQRLQKENAELKQQLQRRK
jgi:cell division protein FtsB